MVDLRFDGPKTSHMNIAVGVDSRTFFTPAWCAKIACRSSSKAYVEDRFQRRRQWSPSSICDHCSPCRTGSRSCHNKKLFLFTLLHIAKCMSRIILKRRVRGLVAILRKFLHERLLETSPTQYLGARWYEGGRQSNSIRPELSEVHTQW